MNRRTAAPVLITMSLVVLMSGCAGAAAQGGQVQDFLRPAGNAAAMGLARGHVIVQDDLSPNRVENRIAAESAARSKADAARSFSADARRELHSQPHQATGAVTWTADARRELHVARPVAAQQSFSDAANRELKGNAPVDVNDDLSPLGNAASSHKSKQQAGTVDDLLSPLGGSR
jgi:hypothetical protein